MPSPLEVVFALPRGSLLLDWAGPAEVLRIANAECRALDRSLAENPFRLRFVAPAEVSESSVGALVAGLAPLPEDVVGPAWLVVVGRMDRAIGGGVRGGQGQDKAVVDWLRRLQPGQASRPGLRLVTVCSGALLAAQAGLLAGRRVTTHHQELARLRTLAPLATVVEDRVFVRDGEVWTSAGVSAGIDLALHLVAEHCGALVAARVAQCMAVALRRGPDDPQLSPLLAHRQHLNARLHQLQDAVSAQPRRPWTAASMAEVAHTTPRTLNRLFARHTGTTPMAYLRDIRLALADTAQQAGSGVTRAAALAGFSSDLQLRRARRARGVMRVRQAAAGGGAQKG